MITTTIIRRFETKFKKSSGCWLWRAALHHSGYGHFQIGGKCYRANRIAYLIYKGKIPRGKQVLHTCDNPACVNPRHLKLGTHQQNMDDKVERNRQTFTTGETNGCAFLTTKLVLEIRRKYKAKRKITQTELARQYGVSPVHIHQIVKGKRWRHLTK